MPAGKARKARRAQQPRTNGSAAAEILTPQNIQTFNNSEAMRLIRDLPAFNQIMLLLQQTVIASLKLLETNEDPMRQTHYLHQWKAFKTCYETINLYIESVVMQRRDMVAEILRDLGFDEDFIAQHVDLSFAPLMGGGQQLSTYPTAPARVAPSPFAGADEENQ